MSSFRFGPAAVAALACLAIPVTPAAAQETSAASCWPAPAAGGVDNPAGGGTVRRAQAFTPSISGTLTRAKIAVLKDGTAGSYVVSLNAVDGGGTPTNTVLATTTVDDSLIPAGFATVDAAFGAPAAVVAGQVYALVITRPGSDSMQMRVRDDCPGSYFLANDGTAGFRSSGLDMVFDAFVTPAPEPETQPQPEPQTGDTSAPQTTITASPKAKTKKKQATFAFTGTDARAVAGFECSLNGAPFTSCTSPLTVKGKKGKNSFAVRAKDAAGNVDATPAAFNWRFKKTKR